MRERDFFWATTERLTSIVAGLDPQPGDTVLSILGSGDQAFALLENGCRVIAYDVCPEQTAFARERVDLLKEGNYEEFLGQRGRTGLPFNKHDIARRLAYFHEKDRIEQIRNNLGNLTIEDGSMFDAIVSVQPTHLYFSNALLPYWLTASKSEGERQEDRLRSTPIGALLYGIYVAVHLEDYGFVVDKGRMKKVRCKEQKLLEFDDPVLYRKVA